MPIGLTRDGLPPGLLDEPQLLEYVDVVALEAVAGTDVPSLPCLLELPPHLLGVALAVAQQVVPDEEGRGVDEGLPHRLPPPFCCTNRHLMSL